ncbi:alpha/beta-hydrolase [Xylariaceae sp. FL1019]|nr:alpha/beta-hydrolase [Xylariaceae sp. FL1019]
MSKPIILVAHGAWHPPLLYQPLKDDLEARGYEVLIPRLAIMGADKTGMSWDSDVTMLLEIAIPLFEQGRQIVLLGHSYGGIPACIATRNQDIMTRKAAGQKGGFSHLLFLCAFAAPVHGMSVLSVTDGNWLPWHQVLQLESGGKQLFVNEKAKPLLYSDFPADKADATFDSLEPCSYEAFTSGVNFAVPDVVIPKAFIVCNGDALFLRQHQEAIAMACGTELKRFSVSGGHSAFVSVPAEVADVVVEFIKQE